MGTPRQPDGDTPVPIVGVVATLLGSRTVSPQRRGARSAPHRGGDGAYPRTQAVDNSVDGGALPSA